MTPLLKVPPLQKKTSTTSLPTLRHQLSTSSLKAFKWVGRKLGKEKEDENDDSSDCSISISGPLSLLSPGRRQQNNHPENLLNVSSSTVAHVARQKTPEMTDVPRPRKQILVDSNEIYNPLAPQGRLKTRLHQKSNASLNQSTAKPDDWFKPLTSSVPSTSTHQDQSAPRQRLPRPPQSVPLETTRPAPFPSAPREIPIIILPSPVRNPITSQSRDLHFVPYEISPGVIQHRF